MRMITIIKYKYYTEKVIVFTTACYLKLRRRLMWHWPTFVSVLTKEIFVADGLAYVFHTIPNFLPTSVRVPVSPTIYLQLKHNLQSDPESYLRWTHAQRPHTLILVGNAIVQH